MADREALQKRYAYHEMSNKVQQADRTMIGSRRSEPTGEVESLRGKQNIGRMGDRVADMKRANPTELLEKNKPKKHKKNKIDNAAGEKQTKKQRLASLTSGGQSILDMNIAGYQPSTPSAVASYEKMLTTLGSKLYLSNQDPAVIRDAAQVVIETLKDQSLRDPERQSVLSQVLLGGKKISPDEYARFVQLGKGMDDFNDVSSQTPDDKDNVNSDMGVAVEFNDSDEEDHESNEGLVRDVSESDDDDDDNDEEDEHEEGPQLVKDDNNSDQEYVVQGGEQTKSSHHSGRVLSVHDMDAHFLQRQLSKHYDDADVCAKIANEVLNILDIRNNSDVRECENKLLVLLGYDLFHTIKLLLGNRVRIWAAVSLKRANNNEERKEVEESLMTHVEGQSVWKELHSRNKARDWSKDRMRGLTSSIKDKKGVTTAIDSIGIKSVRQEDDMEIDKKEEEGPIQLDLDSLAFRDGSHTMSNKSCNLPSNSWRAMKKGYEEVHVPAVRVVPPKDEKLIPITDLPKWTHPAFKGMEKLNRVQSKLGKIALETSENILLCAPTGAGKTNVAMLTMLNILGQYRKQGAPDVPPEDTEPGHFFDLPKFKIIYVAPMKALVQEIVKNFSKRLSAFGITVRELSGDSSLSRHQISETQVIVTTPEKWDVVARQGEGRAYTQLVRLVIIDEIHLLHDERGPVLESITARIIRQVEATAEPVRLVGLSATLPNYADVATFLRVKPEKGLFFFDHSFRPVPLQMQYIGIAERNAFKRFQLQNEICYDKAVVQRKDNNQMLIFVHSRAETGKVAKALRDLALDRDEMSMFVREGGATQEILREESSAAKNADLKEVLPYGFGIHHAGMNRDDRELVEDLFGDGHISVLCCTATLAWGVNLPAHTVIIKGTQIYDPAKGRWAELSPLDIMQMLGRAGRPQYDTEGEGIILTRHSELQYYLSLTNLQLPVESQLVKKLADHMNAEIVLGTVHSLEEAADWLSYTFLYIRMLQNPVLYGMMDGVKTLKMDPTMKRRRLDLAFTAISLLEKNNLIRFDRKSGAVQATPLGRVCSQFYITHTSMATYTQHMRANMSDIELLRLFSLSGEFAHITVREAEKLELAKLVGRVPIPVKESPSEPSAKVNILLQAYISRLKLDGFSLMSDMAFVQQSAARIMRALFEIAIRRKWSGLARLTLDFSNMVSQRIWRSQSPLRQFKKMPGMIGEFKKVPESVARKLERKTDIEWARYADLSPSDLGELVGVPKMGQKLHRLVNLFPRLDVSAQIQPITRSMVRVELTLVPAFEFDILVHGYVQCFHVLVEDVNGEAILHHETFGLKSSSKEQEHVVVFVVPVFEPLPPAYFIRVISDRWLHSEVSLPIAFNKTILPARFPAPTELLDLQPLLPDKAMEPALAKLFSFKEFNPVQTQTFHELFKTDHNVLVCAPSGSGKTTLAELAILRMLLSNPTGKCVYVAPTEDIANPIFSDWRRRLGHILGADKVESLKGETSSDLRVVAAARVVVATVRQWDMLSRRWRQRKPLQQISLMIFDEVHFLGGSLGPTMEVVISRMRFMSSQRKENSLRFVGLSAPLANAREVADWMGVPSKALFNFSPKVRPVPLEIHFQSYDQSSFAARLMSMAKPVYKTVRQHSSGKPTIVFVPSKKQAQLTSIDLITYDGQDGSSFVGVRGDSMSLLKRASSVRDVALQHVFRSGVGYVYEGMIESDWQLVCESFDAKQLGVLVCPVNLCWRIQSFSHLVVIMGTEMYDGSERRHVDYSMVDILHMMGRACRQGADESGSCFIMCHSPKKEYLKKLLYDPLPIESHLDQFLHDHFNTEIVTKTITGMQDAVDYITWTFLYRRLSRNPNYYGLQGTSNVHLSEYLSEMVETVLDDLEESKCCQMSEEGDVTALNLGMIASYYFIKYTSIELIASSVTEKTKIRGIMEILANASEFSALPLRYGEEKTLKSLARILPYQLPKSSVFHEWSTKTLVLLQCHYSRTQLSSEHRTDLSTILKECPPLIQGIVDVISSNGWLKPALAAMELSQMTTQGLWNKDHPLKQIPHFTEAIISRCLQYKGEEPIDSVYDILALDDDVRNELLQLDKLKIADVAVFCNNYPSVEVEVEVEDSGDIVAGEPLKIKVHLERDVDEDDLDDEAKDKLGVVSAPLFPVERREGWWVVVGDTSTNALLSLKKVGLVVESKVTLEFLAPEEAGDHKLTVFCISDSYLGCDQEHTISISVAPANDDDDDSEDTDDSEENEGDEKVED